MDGKHTAHKGFPSENMDRRPKRRFEQLKGAGVPYRPKHAQEWEIALFMSDYPFQVLKDGRFGVPRSIWTAAGRKNMYARAGRAPSLCRTSSRKKKTKSHTFSVCPRDERRGSRQEAAPRKPRLPTANKDVEGQLNRRRALVQGLLAGTDISRHAPAPERAPGADGRRSPWGRRPRRRAGFKRLAEGDRIPNVLSLRHRPMWRRPIWPRTSPPTAEVGRRSAPSHPDGRPRRGGRWREDVPNPRGKGFYTSLIVRQSGKGWPTPRRTPAAADLSLLAVHHRKRPEPKAAAARGIRTRLASRPLLAAAVWPRRRCLSVATAHPPSGRRGRIAPVGGQNAVLTGYGSAADHHARVPDRSRTGSSPPPGRASDNHEIPAGAPASSTPGPPLNACPG